MSHAWYHAPGGKIRCTPPGTTCFITKDFLAEAEVSQFHDDELARATREINQIFERIEKGNKDGSRELAVLETPLGHFLAWTAPDHGETAPEPERVNAESDPDDVKKALKIK